MQSMLTSEQNGSPVPGVILAPSRLRDDALASAPAPPRRRRNPASRLLGALRGDKHMIGAYPPGKER
jgi:hypothetical protein